MLYKKGFFITIFALCAVFFAVAQDAPEGEPATAEKKQAVVPAAKRPRAPDPEKVAAAARKDEGTDDSEKNKRTLEFGMSEEIIALLNTLTENDDPRYVNEIYDLFQSTKNTAVREKIIDYFTKMEDPCISDYAVTVVNDPYDIKRSTVSSVISYITAVKCTDALPALVSLIDSDSDDYFSEAVTAIGEIGGSEEAVYLTELFQNDENSTNRKQSLMRALGKIGAVETWEQLVDIARDSDENSFVRMYAAEAIGNMKKVESVEILAELFEDNDPNFRQYVIKGLRNYSGNDIAERVIVQAVRDDYFRVRVEAIQAVGEMNIKSAAQSVMYRAENDKENVVKKECWPVIASLGTQEGNDFLVKILSDKKKSDSTKVSASEALLKAGNVGEKDIIELALSTVSDDKLKQLRYNLGKLFVKYTRPSFESVCSAYLASKDVTTVSIGLDMYKSGRFSSVESAVRTIADDKKSGANQKFAKRILGIEEE